MQAFYQQLHAARERQSAYLCCLAELTHAKLAWIQAIKSISPWGEWAPER